MLITLNLILDYYNWILREIEKERSNGVSFPTYDEWIKQKGITNTEQNYEQEYKEDMIYCYYNFEQRNIETKKRKIVYAKEFKCPAKYRHGLNILKKKILNGENLFPHLSRQILNPNKQDGILFDYGIYHLHLGTKMDKKNKKLIKGSKDILYCIFDEKYAYFLLIDEHGRWTDKKLVEIIKNNFPKFIEKYHCNGISNVEPDINDKQRGIFRKNGLNAFINLDGDYYLSPGGGINTAGGSMDAVFKLHNTKRYLKKIEKQIQSIIMENAAEIQEKYETRILNLTMINFQKLILIDSSQEITIKVKLDDNNNIKALDIFKK